MKRIVEHHIKDMFKFLFAISLIGATVGWFPVEYPPYCFKDTKTHEIPPLTANQLSKVSSLKQVQFIARHGSRTPYEKYTCWSNYTVPWNNCNVTELMLPSPSYTSQNRPATWLFRKIYDGSQNFLGGNCLTGQLLYEGYVQEEANGRYLAQAYLQNANPNLNLFPTNEWESINATENIYLRSDDQERTLLSGQIIMHSFFNVSEQSIIDWHTGDYDLDQIYPNSEVCPRLDTLQASIFSSPEFVAANSSGRIKHLESQLDIILGAGGWTWDYIYDCMMTAVCTDRQIPSGSAEQGAVMDQAMFNSTTDHVQFTYAFLMTYNDSQWSKLAMGNTAWHVRKNLENMVNYNPAEADDYTPVPYKLAVFGAHDFTVMPFLASILKENWDGHWAGYASLVTIELYAAAVATDSNLFRIVYNGLPQLVPGCEDALCDVDILLNALSFGQEFMSCSVPASDSASTDSTDGDCSDNGSNLGNTEWILIVFLSLVVGTLFGGAAVVFHQKRNNSFNINYTGNGYSSANVDSDSTHHGSIIADEQEISIEFNVLGAVGAERRGNNKYSVVDIDLE